MIHTKKTQTISSLRRVLGWISIVGNPSKSTSHKRGGKNYQTETGQSAGGGGGGTFSEKKFDGAEIFQKRKLTRWRLIWTNNPKFRMSSTETNWLRIFLILEVVPNQLTYISLNLPIDLYPNLDGCWISIWLLGASDVLSSKRRSHSI